ncbi:MAG: phosphoribosylanthranilate isomerase [Candidatus Poribacteria bacterium]|nr:phosphoribosylanthranilate isomerase [Candidatus Poribacteria bacterium]
MTNTRCKVKICGTTNIVDAQMAAEAEADYTGIVVEASVSERSVSVYHAAEIARFTKISTVVLIYNRPVDWIEKAVGKINPFALQLLGDETPDEIFRLKRVLSCEVWKSLFLPSDAGREFDARAINAKAKTYVDAGADALLFDTVDFGAGRARFGGTGKTSDWKLARQLIGDSKIPAFLAGGIRPENVKAAIENVRPFGIDLCSGVESEKGIRDRQRLNVLMQQVRVASNANSS